MLSISFQKLHFLINVNINFKLVALVLHTFTSHFILYKQVFIVDSLSEENLLNFKLGNKRITQDRKYLT